MFYIRKSVWMLRGLSNHRDGWTASYPLELLLVPELGRAYLIIIHGSICMHSVSKKEPSPILILGVEVVAIVDRRVNPV